MRASSAHLRGRMVAQAVNFPAPLPQIQKPVISPKHLASGFQTEVLRPKRDSHTSSLYFTELFGNKKKGKEVLPLCDGALERRLLSCFSIWNEIS